MSRRSLLCAAFLSLMAVTLSVIPSLAYQGDTRCASVSSSGEQGTGRSTASSISADGRYVAFHTYSSNLVPGDTNGSHDVFVHDLQTGETERVSVSSVGAQGNDDSCPTSTPSISADGRYVVFDSLASNLVPGDTNDASDIFVHDRVTGVTERVSVSSTGVQGNAFSFLSAVVSPTSTPFISADGRYIAFLSFASNLVPGDTNSETDVFVRDMLTGETERVSVSSSGEQGNNDSVAVSISADGRRVAFGSVASNLVPGDTERSFDVFVRDRVTGETVCASVSSSGTLGDHDSNNPSISADGWCVVFYSSASNLVPGGNNGHTQVYVHDLWTGETECVSVSFTGVQGNQYSFYPSISADGRYVAFYSLASNLVVGDTNSYSDVFVRDRLKGTTTLVSVSSSGEQGNIDSTYPSISGDGRYVAFDSLASNLVPGDTNGSTDIFVHQYLPDNMRDVAVTGLRINPGRWAVGAPNQAAVLDITNFGNVVESNARAKWLLDDDSNFNDAATDPTPPIEIGSIGGIRLAVGETKSVRVSLTPNWAAGTYYLMGRVEPTTQPDFDRSDNSAMAPISIVAYDFAVTDIAWNHIQSAFYVTVHNNGPSRGWARVNLLVDSTRVTYYGQSDIYLFLENGQTKTVKFPYNVLTPGRKVCEARIIPEMNVPDSHRFDNYLKELISVP